MFRHCSLDFAGALASRHRNHRPRPLSVRETNFRFSGKSSPRLSQRLTLILRNRRYGQTYKSMRIEKEKCVRRLDQTLPSPLSPELLRRPFQTRKSHASLGRELEFRQRETASVIACAARNRTEPSLLALGFASYLVFNCSEGTERGTS